MAERIVYTAVRQRIRNLGIAERNIHSFFMSCLEIFVFF